MPGGTSDAWKVASGPTWICRSVRPLAKPTSSTNPDALPTLVQRSVRSAPLTVAVTSRGGPGADSTVREHVYSHGKIVGGVTGAPRLAYVVASSASNVTLLVPPPQPADPAVVAFFKQRCEGALKIVDGHLSQRDFMLGNKPTIADFSLIGYMYYPTAETGFDLAAQFPNIHRWTERMKALPGWKGPYDLMPGGTVPLRGAAT